MKVLLIDTEGFGAVQKYIFYYYLDKIFIYNKKYFYFKIIIKIK